jgi:nicotinamidase-related amidase
MNHQSMSLPIPPFYNPDLVASVWKVNYEQRAADARRWAGAHQIQPADRDQFKFGLLLIDVQNTFCLPEFELFVAGQSGRGALDDNRRLVEFIYRNLQHITRITATLDTHLARQIFHAMFLVDQDGNHPSPNTLVTVEDIQAGRWKFNPALSGDLSITAAEGQDELEHYTQALAEIGKYSLMIWPYHAMLGGIGHALVSAVEEAVFFHSLARYAQVDFMQKGLHPWTEAYSAIGPEVLRDRRGREISQKNIQVINWLQQLDALAIAGQAKSHCVAWTIEDLLQQIQAVDPTLASRVYLLEDCTSPVVIPGVVDFSEQGDQAYERFSQAGMHLVRSTDALETWPGLKLPSLP